MVSSDFIIHRSLNLWKSQYTGIGVFLIIFIKSDEKTVFF